MSEPEPEPEPEGGWLAMLDQLKAGLNDFAGLVFAYYTALIEQGFAPEQAMMFAMAWQASWIAKAPS